MTIFIRRPLAARFRAVLTAVLAAGLLMAAQAQAQPTSVVVKPVGNADMAEKKLVATWLAPSSGTATEYKVRWAQGAGSITWINADAMAGVSAGTSLTYTVTGLEGGERYDVQVGAVVSGTTTWSASVGGIPGRATLAALALTGSDGQAITLPFVSATTRYVITVATAITTVTATASTIGGGPFGLTKTFPVPDVTAASGGTAGPVALVFGINNIWVGALNDQNNISNIPHKLVITRPAPLAVEPPVNQPVLTLTGIDQALEVGASWTAPPDDIVESYEITWRTADPDAGGPMTAGKWQSIGGDDPQCAEDDDPGAADNCGRDTNNFLTHRIRNLINGTAYEVRVRAINRGGNGPWSAAQTHTVGIVEKPGAPASVSATAGMRIITVRWGAPLNTGGGTITQYRVRWRLSDADGAGSGSAAGAWQDSVGDDEHCNDGNVVTDALCGARAIGTNHTITGLDKVSYDVAVAAVNTAGAGAWSGDTAAQATPIGFADATLSSLTLSAGALSPVFDSAQENYTALIPNATASLAMTATLNEENASFTLKISSLAAAAGVSRVASVPFRIDPSERATFIFVVTADNGSAMKTYTVAATRIGAPEQPRNTSATAGPRQIAVDWDAPERIGGADITSYRVRWRLSDADGAGSGTAAGDWQDLSGADAECDSAIANDHECGEGVTGATEYTITGLDKVSYDVAVAAVNSIGAGAWSGATAAQATPVTSSDATFSALRFSAGTLAPVFDGARADYTAIVPSVTSIAIIATLNEEHASFTVQIGAGSPVAGVSGVANSPGVTLAAGGSQTFTLVVTADDGATMKTYRVVATAAELPAAPSDVTVIKGNRAYSLDWVAPAATPGAPIIGYRVRWTTVADRWNGSGGAEGVATGSADTTWNSPTLRGAFAFAVAAVNAAGVGAWDRFEFPLMGGFFTTENNTPVPPTNLIATSTADSLRLSWTAVDMASGYKVRWKADAATIYGAARSVTTGEAYTITSLSAGAYDVQVAAFITFTSSTETTTATSIWANATFRILGTDNADLNALFVHTTRDAGTTFERPLAFSGGTLSYHFDVGPSIVTASVTPHAAHSGARIRVTAGAAAPVVVASGSSASGSLIGGVPFVFRIAVTSEDGQVTKTYIVTLLREPESLKLPDFRHLYFHADGARLQPVTLPAATGGIVPYTYDLTANPRFPPGLSFNAATRTLEGAFTGVTARTEYTFSYSVVDADMSSIIQGGLFTSFLVTVAPPLAFASALPALTFEYDTAATKTLPAISGGFTPRVLTLEGDALPSGLVFDGSDRSISGTPTQSGVFNITYKVTDAIGAEGTAAGILRTDFSLRVLAGSAGAPAGLSIAPANTRLRLSWRAPSDTGGEAPSGYRVRWAEGSASEIWLEAGGGAAGTPTGSARTFYSITGLTNGTLYPVQVAAVNSAGTGTWSASVESTPANALAFVAQQDDLFVLASKELAAPIVLPEAEQGSLPYTYALQGLPAGLSFDKDTRGISGTPGALPAAVTLTYMVSDSATATDQLEFTLSTVTFDLDLDAADDSAEAVAVASDGIITARYLLGVRGASLVRGQAAGGAGEFEAVLKIGVDSQALNVDGDADVDGDDGILIARYLLGLRGEALVAGFAGLNGETVAGNIADLLPDGL